MIIELNNGESIQFQDCSRHRMFLLKVTTSCNLQCSYCWYNINPQLRVSEKEEMNTASLIQLLATLKLGSTDVIFISGGEPVLRQDIEVICQYLHETKATVNLTTNGILLDRLLCVSPYVDGYIVSLDSPDERYHNQVRGDHARIVSNIPVLQKKRPVCVTVTLSRENLNSLPDLADQCILWGVDSIFCQLLWAPSDHPLRRKSCLDQRDWSDFRKVMGKLRELSDVLHIPNEGYLQLMESIVRSGGAHGVVKGCFAKQGYLSISPRGFINNCLPYSFIHKIQSSKEASSQHLGTVGEGGVCNHFSEECSCLIGQYFSEVFCDRQ